MQRLVLAGVAGLLVLTAGAAAPAAAQKKDRYLISLQEIQERQDFITAYDAVKSLRSQWLRPARPKGDMGAGAFGASPYRPKPEKPGAEGSGGENSAAGEAAAAARDAQFNDANKKKVQAIVYIDEMKQSGDDLEDILRSVRIAEVAEIRYMNGTEASARYGAGHEAGAIMVKTNRAGR